MKLPENWNDITVGQFQEIFSILSAPAANEIELANRQLNLIAVITGLNDAELNAMPLDKFKGYAQTLQWLTDITALERYPLRASVTLNNVKYNVCLEVSKLKAGQFIDLTNFTKQGAANMANVHNILAVLLTKPGKHYCATGTPK